MVATGSLRTDSGECTVWARAGWVRKGQLWDGQNAEMQRVWRGRAGEERGVLGGVCNPEKGWEWE